VNSALFAGGVSKIVVVTGYKRELLTPFIDGKNTIEAYNAGYDRGMFSSVCEGIKKLKEVSEDSLKGFLLMPVDHTAVGPDIVSLILNNENTGDRFIVPCYCGKTGHPLWIPGCFIDEILSSGGDEGLRGVTAQHGDEMIRVETGRESVVLDMDTGEEYGELLKYWQRAAKAQSM
jgi:CTP:molybdopterin cytidylyltransferase MocA